MTGSPKPFPGTQRRAPVTAWLVRASSSRRVSLGLVVAIALTDHFVQWHRLSFLERGLVDEPCHFATAMIVLGALSRWRGRPPSTAFTRAMLISSVAIDVDHLPLEFGSPVLTAGTPRPYTHALWVVVLSAAIALAFRHRARVSGSPAATTVTAIAAGTAWGLAAHFLRDIVTAPISLWWPVTDAPVELPYAWYVIALLLLAAIPSRHRDRGQD